MNRYWEQGSPGVNQSRRAVLGLANLFAARIPRKAERSQPLLSIKPPLHTFHTSIMGLFGSSQASLPPPKIAADGAPIAPDRSQRSQCWEARDAYFKCLDKNEIIDSITENDKAEKSCGKEAKGFEKNCATSWVGYSCRGQLASVLLFRTG